MYTEFIFGCKLSKDTPKICIDALDYAINGGDKQPKYDNPQTWQEENYNKWFIVRTTPEDKIQEFMGKYDFARLFFSGSYYFGAPGVRKFYYDPIDKEYHISTRANLKNYSNQIEKFIEYIKPYVTKGSGYPHNIFAYVQYEESEFPTMYGMDGVYTMCKETK